MKIVKILIKKILSVKSEVLVDLKNIESPVKSEANLKEQLDSVNTP